ncbi:MAG: MotA/TolQ/ExbB proton channel family protein [Pseudomonadota bacterium]
MKISFKSTRRIKIYWLLWFLLSPPVFSDKIAKSLQTDIKQAQQKLAKLQRNTQQKNLALNQRITHLQKEVLELREKTAATRRSADEKTLSLQTLQKRLESWKEQHTYQINLLSRYAANAGLDINASSIQQKDLLRLIEANFDEQKQQLYPHWKKDILALNSGQLQEVQSLKIGPVTWYINTQNQSAGLMDTSQPTARIAYPFNASITSSLFELAQNQSGKISFDPTLNRAITEAQHQESFVQHLRKGGLWVLPILLFGVILLVLTTIKSIHITRLPSLQPALAQRIKRSGFFVTNAIQQSLLDIIQQHPIGKSRDDALFSALQAHKQKLERGLTPIAVTAGVAPLLGLLGTVSGMIETFKLMTLFGAGDPAAVSGGISEALVTTELGLVVAIPALLSHAFLSRKIKSYYGDIEQCAIELSSLEYPTSRQAI